MWRLKSLYHKHIPNYHFLNFVCEKYSLVVSIFPKAFIRFMVRVLNVKIHKQYKIMWFIETETQKVNSSIFVFCHNDIFTLHYISPIDVFYKCLCAVIFLNHEHSVYLLSMLFFQNQMTTLKWFMSSYRILFLLLHQVVIFQVK